MIHAKSDASWSPLSEQDLENLTWIARRGQQHCWCTTWKSDHLVRHLVTWLQWVKCVWREWWKCCYKCRWLTLILKQVPGQVPSSWHPLLHKLWTRNSTTWLAEVHALHALLFEPPGYRVEQVLQRTMRSKLWCKVIDSVELATYPTVSPLSCATCLATCVEEFQTVFTFPLGFLATGFHGLQGFITTVSLLVWWICMTMHDFTQKDHMGFEGAPYRASSWFWSCACIWCSSCCWIMSKSSSSAARAPVTVWSSACVVHNLFSKCCGHLCICADCVGEQTIKNKAAKAMKNMLY